MPHERTIGIFGANCFIGRALVRALRERGRRVVAFGRAFDDEFFTAVGGPVTVRTIDFNDAMSGFAAVQGVDTVVQFVNSSSPAMGNSRLHEDILSNIVPHVKFIESCVLARVSRYLFISSGGTVYGNARYVPIDEGHPTQPINSYGMTKLTVEHYLRMICAGTGMADFTLRLSNPYGPGQTFRKSQGLVAAILKNHRADQPTGIFGNGGVERDYLFIDDTVAAIATAIDTDAPPGTYNIGSGIGRSVLDVIGAVERALGTTLAVEYLPERPTDAHSNILNCAKAERLLGWTATVPFDVGIRRTVEAMLQAEASPA
jgi:UDP-glucose 4-epimerase